AAELLTRAVKGEIRPVCAVAKPGMFINLLGQATDREPMKTLIGTARAFEQQVGIHSVSVMAGFPYADVPDAGASVIAVADGDGGRARDVAGKLATILWAMREHLNVPCPQPDEAVRRAIASDRPPVLLVDLGDNVGGGSAGDGTVLLAELLRQGAKGFVVVLYAPEAVRRAEAAGVGGAFEGPVGGAVDRMHGDPVAVRGTVRSLH